MIVEPNSPIDYVQECVLCEEGAVLTADGRITPLDDIDRDGTGFKDLCKSMDPNKGFIMAFVPKDTDRPVFFRAREVARSIGIHMQGTLEQPDTQRLQWETYKRMRELKTAPADSEVTVQ
jgi:hypothetical protein